MSNKFQVLAGTEDVDGLEVRSAGTYEDKGGDGNTSKSGGKINKTKKGRQPKRNVPPNNHLT